jgi:hypothetical protein
MKEEVAQHCVRLLDARDTLRGHYDRDYQLRAMGYFILVAKFHNRIQVKVKKKINLIVVFNKCIHYLAGRIFSLFSKCL